GQSLALTQVQILNSLIFIDLRWWCRRPVMDIQAAGCFRSETIGPLASRVAARMPDAARSASSTGSSKPGVNSNRQTDDLRHIPARQAPEVSTACLTRARQNVSIP